MHEVPSCLNLKKKTPIPSSLAAALQTESDINCFDYCVRTALIFT